MTDGKSEAEKEKREDSLKSASSSEAEASTQTGEGKKKKSKAPAKPKKMSRAMSQRKRKEMDERFEKNKKGRLVSKKKSENGKRNVQARAIKLARKLLGFEGRMILLGKGSEGVALVDLCRDIRTCLKEGKSDDAAEALFAIPAEKLREGFKKEEKKEEKSD